MPKMKTSRAAAKRFKKTGTRLIKEKQSLQEPYLDQEIYQEKEKSEKVHHHRCDQRTEHEEDFTVFIRVVDEEENKRWQESKAV